MPPIEPEQHQTEAQRPEHGNIQNQAQNQSRAEEPQNDPFHTDSPDDFVRNCKKRRPQISTKLQPCQAPRRSVAPRPQGRVPTCPPPVPPRQLALGLRRMAATCAKDGDRSLAAASAALTGQKEHTAGSMAAQGDGSSPCCTRKEWSPQQGRNGNC